MIKTQKRFLTEPYQKYNVRLCVEEVDVLSLLLTQSLLKKSKRFSGPWKR
jgi:hypothetical protein